MFWIIILVLLYLGYAYLKGKEKTQVEKNLEDEDHRRSYVQNLIEEQYQKSLNYIFSEIKHFKKELEKTEKSNNKQSSKEAKFHLKYLNNQIVGLKSIRRELVKSDNPIWRHSDFSENGLTDIKDKLQSQFASAVSYAMHKIYQERRVLH